MAAPGGPAASAPPSYQDSLKAVPLSVQASAPPAAAEVKIADAKSSAQAAADDAWARFQGLVKQKELNPLVADKLYRVLNTTDIVLLCDDSDSMSQAISEESTDPFAPRRSTRWLELKRLCSEIIQFTTAINPEGIDIYFLNRPQLVAVKSVAGLQTVFAIPPEGPTPLVSALETVSREKGQLRDGRQLLIVVVTDGEPQGGPKETREGLKQSLMNITRSGRVHVSFAEATDQVDDMQYLDAWDGLITNFDNSDCYPMELERVRNIQGLQFKFDYCDYVCKVLLATFDRWFFNLDQVKVFDTRSSVSNGNSRAPAAVWSPPPQNNFAAAYSQQSAANNNNAGASNNNAFAGYAAQYAMQQQQQQLPPNYAYNQQQQAPTSCCVIL